MALNETRVQSTPKVLVDGVIVPVVPNSVSVKFGGESSVRAISAGSSAIRIVQGVNAEELKGYVKFSIPNTAANAERMRGWRVASNKGLPVAIEVVTETDQYPFADMYLENNPEANFEHEGDIELEFCGRYVE